MFLQVKIKFLIIFAVVLITLEAALNDKDWNDYKIRHSKKYKTKNDESDSYNRYKAKDLQIKKHNAKFDKGEVHFKLNHNRFSDMSAAQLNQIMPIIEPNATARSLPVAPSLPRAPSELSYQEYCQRVQDQADCGCCWAFAATAQLETAIKIKNPYSDLEVSTQHVMDCSVNSGCSGGWPANAFNFLYRHGCVSAEYYPYVAYKQSCMYTPYVEYPIVSQPVMSFMNGDEQRLMNTLYYYGPVVILMKVDLSIFMSYQYGVYNEPYGPSNCASYNHAMLLIGYGTDEYTYEDYWLVKNSFGPQWGESGYLRVIRNGYYQRNNCNIGCYIFYAEV